MVSDNLYRLYGFDDIVVFDFSDEFDWVVWVSIFLKIFGLGLCFGWNVVLFWLVLYLVN